MKNRIAAFVVTSLLTCSIYQFGCSGGGGGDQPPQPPPTPFKTQTLVIYGQEVTKSAGTPAEVPGFSAEITTYPYNSFMVIDNETNPDKEGAIFVKNFTDLAATSDPYAEAQTVKAVDKTLLEPEYPSKRLSPKGNFLVLGNTAPNGDVFLANRAGIFISNAITGETKLLMGMQELLTSFYENKAGENFVWNQNLINELQHHFLNPDPSWAYTFPNGDGYVTFLIFSHQFSSISASSNTYDTATLYLRYDSATGKIERVFPTFKKMDTIAYRPFLFNTSDKGILLNYFRENIGNIILQYNPITKTIEGVSNASMSGYMSEGKWYYVDWKASNILIMQQQTKDLTDYFSSVEKLLTLKKDIFNAPVELAKFTMPDLSNVNIYGIYGQHVILQKVLNGNVLSFAALNVQDRSQKIITDKHANTLFLSNTKDGPVALYQKFESAAAANAVEKSPQPMTFAVYDITKGVEKDISKSLSMICSNLYCTKAIPSFVDVDSNSETRQNGISFDGKYAFISMLDAKGIVSSYKKDLSVEATDSATDGPLGAGWTLSVPNSTNNKVTYELKAKIKDKLIWLEKTEASAGEYTYALYWNKLDNTELKKMDDLGSVNTSNTIKLFQVTKEPVPLDTAVKFDMSVDPNLSFACSSASTSNAFCLDPKQMCIDGVCKDMFSCSEWVPAGWCAEGKTCDHGQCITKSSCAPYSEPTNGTCPEGFQLQNGCCGSVVECTPQCDEKSCGSDGCGGSCGTCADGKTCDGLGQCVDNICTPTCGNKECGPSGCPNLSCGTCTGGKICSEQGMCVTGTCTPSCTNKSCGDSDGCGGKCDVDTSCGTGKTCENYACILTQCVPNCDGKMCGPDGCSGSCGTCEDEGFTQMCSAAGQCVTAPLSPDISANRYSTVACSTPILTKLGVYSTNCRYAFMSNFLCLANSDFKYKYAFHRASVAPQYTEVADKCNASSVGTITEMKDITFTGTKTNPMNNDITWKPLVYKISLTDSTLNESGTIYTSSNLTINKE